MTRTEDGSSRAARSRVTLGPAARATALLAVLTVTVTFLLWLPRPVAPTELPILILETSAIERSLARDAAATRLPASKKIDRLDTLYREQGLAESGPGETALGANRRQAMLRSILLELRGEHGDDAVTALRKRHVSKLEPALAGTLDNREAREVLGSFIRMLKRYGLIEDGQRVAPPFVVRTLYKARWNAIFGLDFTDGFSRIERQAYYGWRAFHGREENAAARLDALDAYEKAGGARAELVRGVLLYQLEHYGEAADVFDRAYARTGNLRYRNYQLAALHMAINPSQ